MLNWCSFNTLYIVLILILVLYDTWSPSKAALVFQAGLTCRHSCDGKGLVVNSDNQKEEQELLGKKMFNDGEEMVNDGDPDDKQDLPLKLFRLASRFTLSSASLAFTMRTPDTFGWPNPITGVTNLMGVGARSDINWFAHPPHIGNIPNSTYLILKNCYLVSLSLSAVLSCNLKRTWIIPLQKILFSPLSCLFSLTSP